MENTFGQQNGENQEFSLEKAVACIEKLDQLIHEVREKLLPTYPKEKEAVSFQSMPDHFLWIEEKDFSEPFAALFQKSEQRKKSVSIQKEKNSRNSHFFPISSSNKRFNVK